MQQSFRVTVGLLALTTVSSNGVA